MFPSWSVAPAPVKVQQTRPSHNPSSNRAKTTGFCDHLICSQVSEKNNKSSETERACGASFCQTVQPLPMYFTWFNIQPFCFVNQIDSHHWQMALWLIGCGCFQIIWRWGSESEFLRAPDCHALVSFIHALLSFQSREFPHLKIIEQKPPKMINTS